MTFVQMKAIEPELGRLEESAQFAGEHLAEWPATFAAIYETLSKLAGRGALDDRLQTARAYEAARRELFFAWKRGRAIAARENVQAGGFVTAEAYR